MPISSGIILTPAAGVRMREGFGRRDGAERTAPLKRMGVERSRGQYRAFARIATTLLHAPLPWVTTLLYPTASERGECMLAMLFWVLAGLAVVGALAIDWGLYLLVRRWL